jgi:DNA topoisomerase VI subunit A
MLGHSQHFSKLLTLMEFIDSQLESQGEGKMNKRAIYYHHKDKAIETQGELDQYIGEICQIVGVTRDDLRIVSLFKVDRVESDIKRPDVWRGGR